MVFSKCFCTGFRAFPTFKFKVIELLKLMLFMVQNNDKDLLGIYQYGCDPFCMSLLTDSHLKVRCNSILFTFSDKGALLKTNPLHPHSFLPTHPWIITVTCTCTLTKKINLQISQHMLQLLLSFCSFTHLRRRLRPTAPSPHSSLGDFTSILQISAR